MKQRLLKIFVCLFVLMNSHSVFAQYDYGFDFSKAGSAGLQFLKIGVGAKETAMGEAVSGIVNDVNSVFWNTAGLAYVDKYQASFTHNNWLVDSKHIAAAVGVPLGSFVVGLSVVSLDINDFEETTVTNPDGTGKMVSAGDIAIGLSVARKFTDKLSIGAQVKYVQETLDDRSFSNVLFDIGTIYYTGFHQLRLAFALQHFGPDMKLVDQEFRTPLLFRVSATDDIIQTDNLNLLLAAELVHPTDNNEWVNIGMELKLLEYFAIRGGHRINVDEGKWSFGMGLTPPVLSSISTRFDYAFVVSENVFDNVHRFSLMLGFD